MASIKNLDSENRIVIKIGSSLIVDKKGYIREKWLASLIEDICSLRKKQKDIIIVTSGAIAIGTNILNIPKNERIKLDIAQGTAAVGQIELMAAFKNIFAKRNINVAQLLLTIEDTEQRRRYLNARNTISMLINNNVIPIINENDTVATTEIRYGDNDRLAARVCTMSSADCLIILSDVDGIYTLPPDMKDAVHIPEINKITNDIKNMAKNTSGKYGSGGMVTKIEAARIAMDGGAHMVIANGQGLNPIQSIVEGKRASWFIAKVSPQLARKRWISGMLKPSGKVFIDSGASSALKKGRSLLPAGVVSIKGKFQRGDAVIIIDDNDNEIARGLIAYSYSDAQKIKNKNTDEIENILGYRERAALVHRDDLVITNKE
tara:strand:- start:3684 stop:4811 length:1128 start_codon:yes stop_codon:yes gene_type:complete